MNRSTLEAIQAGQRFPRVPLTRSLALSLLACLACLPAVADSASFQVATTGTLQVGNIANVTYAAIPGPIPYAFLYQVGNAVLTGSTTSPWFSWNNGTLSMTPESFSGWADSQTGSGYFGARAAGSQDDRSMLEIKNTNGFGVEVPFTMSLTYTQGFNCLPACNLNSSWAQTNSSFQVY